MGSQPKGFFRGIVLSSAVTFSDVPWEPRADVYRISRGWLVKFELAGVSPSDLEILARGRLITLRGNRRDFLVERRLHSLSMEIAYSRFERTIQFPENVEGAEIATEYKDGMFLVQLLTGESE
jgi:HSP20 family protein